jgi:pyruvate kinase
MFVLLAAGMTLDLPHMGPECTAGLKWAASQHVDYVTVPYVRGTADIQLVRNILDEAGAVDTAIIAQVQRGKLAGAESPARLLGMPAVVLHI